MHRRARFEEESASASVEERLRLSGALPCGASAAADRRGSARRRKERIVATLVSLMESKDPEAQWNLEDQHTPNCGHRKLHRGRLLLGTWEGTLLPHQGMIFRRFVGKLNRLQKLD
jgi:hypothetical protein